jgi:hypothetical protein
MDGLAPCKGGFHSPSLLPSGMERGDVDYGTDCFLSFFILLLIFGYSYIKIVILPEVFIG